MAIRRAIHFEKALRWKTLSLKSQQFLLFQLFLDFGSKVLPLLVELFNIFSNSPVIFEVLSILKTGL